MNILLITNLYGPESRGGAEMIAKQTAEEMVRQGHAVTVLSTTAKRGKGLADSVDADVTVFRYHPGLPYHILEDAIQPLWKRLAWHRQDLLSAMNSRAAVRGAIDRSKPDVIITHNLRGMGMGLVREIRGAGVKWVHTLHDVQLLVPSGLLRLDCTPFWQRSVITGPYRGILRQLIASPNLVIGPTNYILDTHKEAGFFPESDLRVLQNPVDIDPVVRSGNVVTGRDLPRSGKLKLLYVGQLEPHKGVHVLMEALQQMGELQVELDIVGDGSQTVELTELALQTPETVTVNFHGRVPHAQVFTFMREVDALVFPSVAIENCPGVILEANGMGLPVIGSDQGGVPELIDSSGLFEPGNVSELAERIKELAKGNVLPLSDFAPTTLTAYTKHLLS